jgi:hypothetical protein
VKKRPWRTTDFRGKEEDCKTKSGKKKAEEVNVAKQEDSGSDSSWFVRDAGESIQEGSAEWVLGDGIEDEDINEDEVMKQDEATKAYKQEKSEKRDVVDDINAEDKHDDEKPEKKEGVKSSSSTYLDRQSSTKTEAVLRYVDLPILTHFVQFVTHYPAQDQRSLRRRM